MNFIKKYLLLICALFLIASGFFLYQSFVGYHDNLAAALGRTAGRATGSTIYALTFFFMANFFRKKLELKRLKFVIFCFTVFFSFCALYDAIKFNTQFRQSNNTMQEMTAFVEDFENKTLKKSTNEYSQEEYGDFAKILPIIKKSMEFSEKMMIEMNLASSKLENIFVLEGLCDNEHLIQAKKCVANFSSTLNHWEQEYESQFALLEKQINEAFTDNENLKKQFLMGFEDGKKISNKITKKYFHIEKEGVQALEDFFNFFSAKLGTISVSENTLIFETDKDLDVFNQLIQNLEYHAQKEEIISKKLEAHNRLSIQKIKNWDMN